MITNFSIVTKDISSLLHILTELHIFFELFWKLHKFFPILIPVLRDFLQNRRIHWHIPAYYL